MILPSTTRMLVMMASRILPSRLQELEALGMSVASNAFSPSFAAATADDTDPGSGALDAGEAATNATSCPGRKR